MVGDDKAGGGCWASACGPGQWNCLALVATGDAVTAYVDGRPVASEAVAGLQIEDSPLPLQVGNWYGNDRPFHGLIKEIRILNRALSAKEVAENALAHPRGRNAECGMRNPE